MEAIGGDADLRAHAELASVGELRRGVVQHDRAVHPLQKALRRRLILGDDGFGMRRAVLGDVRDRAVDAVHDAQRR